MILPFAWPWGFMRGSGGASELLQPLVITMIPTEGQEIDLPETLSEIILNLKPATDLELFSIKLPNNQSPREGQRVFVSCTRTVEQFTASANTPVNGGVVMFSPGNNYVWLQNDGQIWSRVTA